MNKDTLRKNFKNILNELTTNDISGNSNQIGGKKYTKEEVQRLIESALQYLMMLYLKAEEEKKILTSMLQNIPNQSNQNNHLAPHNTILPIFQPNPMLPPNPNDKFDDPVGYTEEEKGTNYTISIKKSNKLKIIAENIFRPLNRNTRLPEYLSGILCTVNNFPTIMGKDWGYRLYYDINILKKNMIIQTVNEESTHYSYKAEFEKGEIDKWKKLFENRDEGEIFSIFLKQLNNLDYVELYKVTLNDSFLIKGYPFALLGTNYRFHASLDKTKTLVCMKDADYAFKPENKALLDKFEASNKTITYFFFPWYKPPSHAIIQYPFTVIAYCWSIKPNLVSHHYTFDGILEYFKKFDDDEQNFFSRKKSKTLEEKASYGSDEIVLTDYIFSGFKSKDQLPLGQLYDFNTIILFYVFYEIYMNDSTTKTAFEQILKDELLVCKNKIDADTKIKKILDTKWNINDINEFLFGTQINKFCCILPLYNKIPDKARTKIFYMAYIATLANIDSEDGSDLNFRDHYFNKLSEYMRIFSDKSLSDTQIDEDIFNHTYTNNSGWSPMQHRIMLPNNPDYLFNRYYNIKIHIPAFYSTAESDKEPLWGFLNNVINKASLQFTNNKPLSYLHKLFFDKKTNFIFPLWGTYMEFPKIYDKCVTNMKLTLQVGAGSGSAGVGDRYGTYGTYDNNSKFIEFNCKKGDYNVEIKYIPDPGYFCYTNRYKPLLDNTNPIITGNMSKLYNDDKFITRITELLKISKKLLADYIKQFNLTGSGSDINTDTGIAQYTYNSTLNPKFHAVAWKLFKCIIDKTKTADNFIFSDSGNLLAYQIFKHPQFPWDDDIDVGFITDDLYTEYFKFMKDCMDQGFEVFVYSKLDPSLTVLPAGEKWYDAKHNKVIKLTPAILKTLTPDNVWFIKVTFPSDKFNRLKTKINLTDNYSFDSQGTYSAVPWVDVQPFTKVASSTATYKYKYGEIHNMKTPVILDSNKKVTILDINIKIPDNTEQILDKYKKKAEYETKAVIYNHVSKEKAAKTINYTTQDIKDFNRAYITEHNETIKQMNALIECSDF
jgi:hypothetical protein